MAAVRDDEFAAVVERERPLLQGIAYLLTGDAERADRLVQAVWARMYENWDQVTRPQVEAIRALIVAEPLALDLPWESQPRVRVGGWPAADGRRRPSPSWRICAGWPPISASRSSWSGTPNCPVRRSPRCWAGRSTRSWCWPGRPGPRSPQGTPSGYTTPRWPANSPTRSPWTIGPRTAVPTISRTAGGWFSGVGCGAGQQRWPPLCCWWWASRYCSPIALRRRAPRRPRRLHCRADRPDSAVRPAVSRRPLQPGRIDLPGSDSVPLALGDGGGGAVPSGPGRRLLLRLRLPV